MSYLLIQVFSLQKCCESYKVFLSILSTFITIDSNMCENWTTAGFRLNMELMSLTNFSEA